MKSPALPFTLLVLSGALLAQAASPVTLPPPQTDGGMPLMQALGERRSQREFAPESLPPQILSNLLWAAWGVSRPDSGKRTAPSAMNRQEMDVYVVRSDGAYRYEAGAHRLVPVAGGDLRPQTGTQPFVATAPVNLVYVSRVAAGSREDRLIYGGAQAGFLSQNVYLYCASAGLATVVRGSIQRDGLAKALHLPAGQTIILAQTVGFPIKP